MNLKKLSKTLYETRIDVLETLLQEINEHEYDTVAQIRGHIHTNIGILNKALSRSQNGDDNESRKV